MEPLIFALIIMAIGAFFNNKKSDAGKEVPKRPDRPEGNTQQKRFNRVEDYAKEIYGELQTKVNENPDRRDQVNRKIEEVVERAPRNKPDRQIAEQAAKEAAKKPAASKPGRLSAHQTRPVVQKAEPEKNDELLPLSNDDVQRGIIMAEILMPPKSKR